MMEHTEAYSLYELNALVRQVIGQELPDEYWVQAELSDVHTNASGHCYLEFVQKDPHSNAFLAKARGMIWNHVFRLLKSYFEQETGQAFVSGIKVLVRVKVGFHELYGYSLTVVDIDPSYTLGDMARRRKEILSQLEAEGVLMLNKELSLPRFAQRIAVISSATAAGYGDFCNQLLSNRAGLIFYPRLFPAVMQGNQVEKSIIAALDAIYAEADCWDAVVIIRGGGATSDLSGFDTYLLASNCAQFPLPIITGIGHERDDTVIDAVAHTRVKTPTAAAEFLINHLSATAAQLDQWAGEAGEAARNRMEQERLRLQRVMIGLPSRVQLRCLREDRKLQLAFNRLQSVLPMQVSHEHQRLRALIQQIHRVSPLRLSAEKYHLSILEQRLKTVCVQRLSDERHRLDMFQKQVEHASPERLLQKGYSIVFHEGKAVTDPLLLTAGDRIEVRVAKGTFLAEVE